MKKRQREEDQSEGPPQTVKRIAGPWADESLEGGGNDYHATLDDALMFVKDAKETFKSKGKYDEFLKVLKDFNEKRLDLPGVIKHVKELFKEHQNLILGFNKFVPRGGESSEGGRSDYYTASNDALMFVKDVMDTFKGKRKYDEFLKVLKDFKAKRLDLPGVIKHVKELFKGHRSLILGFNKFVSQGGESSEGGGSNYHATLDDALMFVKDVKETFKDKEKYNEFLKVLKDFKTKQLDLPDVIKRMKKLFKEHQNLLLGFYKFVPQDYEITLPLEAEDVNP